MPDKTFAEFVADLSVDVIGGAEKIPLLDGSTTKYATASLLAAFAVDQLHQAAVVTTLNDADEVVAFQSDVEKIITAQNFFNWLVDKLEALGDTSTVVSGDKLLINDGGVLKQIDIDDIKAFLDSEGTSLGAQIAALASATLADTDQYVVSQAGVAAKTTFTAIAARVHSQFLAYLVARPAVVTLADKDAFFVNDGGVASKVEADKIAEYVQSKVGGAILSSAWDDYSAIGGAAAGTDVFLIERSGTGRTITAQEVSNYIIPKQDSASNVVSGNAGDDLLMFRSGTQYKVDIDVLATYVIDKSWSSTSGSPVVTADKVLIGRGGDTFTVTVDQLTTFVLDGVQADVLNLTGLTDASLASGSIFLVGDGVTPKKTTLASLETKLWTDYQAYVTSLTALTGLADADTFYVIDGGVAKKIAASNIAAYSETYLWDKSDATPTVQTGDNLWMRRGGTSYTLDVTELANFVSNVAASNINVGALSDATLSDSDLLLVDEGASNTKVTMANFRSHLWNEFITYVTGLTDGVSASDTDLIYLINTGAPVKLTVGQLWDTRFLADAKEIKLDDFAAPDDNTDLNATSGRHGLLPKLSNNAREVLKGDGTWGPYASATAAATAATGSLHTDAAALAATNVTFITSDSAAKGVKLPNGQAGDILEVINNSSTAAKLYPATGGTLNGLGTNAAVLVPASKGVRCFCSAADTWTVFEMTAKAATA